jgi:L-lactate permease
MRNFLDTLRIQRWDDHRYYHHSLVNQSLHLLSAVSFVIAYMLIYKDPWLGALIGWLISMTSRQMGHFFFEPRDYDVNQATDEYKEAIKVGYNIRRKIVLMAVWALSPVVLLVDPTMLGLVAAPRTWVQFARHLGYLWLAVGVFGLMFRTVQLFLTRDVMTGIAWATKILTDPFHDIKLYYRAPFQLVRGGLIHRTLTADPEEGPVESFQ